MTITASNKTGLNFRFAFLIVLAHIIWFLVALTWKQLTNDDSQEYLNMAINLGHGLFYSGPPNQPIDPFYVSLRTPLYSGFILLIHSLLGQSIWMIILIQNIISIFVCIFCLKVFQDYFPAKRTWFYYLFIIFYPVQMIVANLIAPDGLLQLFVLLYFYHFIKALTAKKGKYIAYSSLWLILAFLAKPIMYPFALVHFVWAGYWMLRYKKWVAITYGLIPILFVFGYGNFIKSQTGFFHISSVQPLNLLNYNVKSFHQFTHGRDWADSVNKQNLALLNQQAKSFQEHYELEEAMARDTIKKHFWAYGFYHSYKSIRYFFEPGKANIDLATGLNSLDNILHAKNPVSFATSWEKEGVKGIFNYLAHYPLLPLLFLIFLFNILRVAGFLVFLSLKKVPVSIRLSTLLLIGYFAVVTGPVSFETRYFIPILCIMSLAATIGLFSVWDRWRNRLKK